MEALCCTKIIKQLPHPILNFLERMQFICYEFNGNMKNE